MLLFEMTVSKLKEEKIVLLKNWYSSELYNEAEFQI